MKKVVMKLDGGATLEITDDILVMVSNTGVRTFFNRNGYPIKTNVVPVESMPSYLKYFCLMGKEEREDVRQWLSDVASKTKKQADFLKIVGEALTAIDYNYRIVTIEPSWDDSQRLFYMNGEKVARGLSCREWKAKCKKFAPEWDSDLANLYELFLWYGYRIAKRLWTLEYVCDDSSSAGNYRNSPDASHDFEVSGKREVGGFADGVGNTYKIVAHKAGFAACGGNCNGDGRYYPVADVDCYSSPYCTNNDGSGVLVLRGSTDH